MNNFDQTSLLSLIDRLKEEYRSLENELSDSSKKDFDQIWKVSIYLNNINSLFTILNELFAFLLNDYFR